MDKELKVTEERVREAAASCSTAKQVLEKLFPEAFVGKSYSLEDFVLREDKERNEVNILHKPSSMYLLGIDMSSGKFYRHPGVWRGDFPVDTDGRLKEKE